MRHLSMWALILCLPITFGCQRLIDLSSGEGTYVDPGTQQGSANRVADFVADRDGNLYAISCLRQERDQIVAGGQEAAEGCRLGNIKTRTLSKGVKEGRG